MPSFEAQVGSTTYYFVAILVILHFAALVSLLTYFIQILHEEDMAQARHAIFKLCLISKITKKYYGKVSRPYCNNNTRAI
jgi:hypothetical protein